MVITDCIAPNSNVPEPTVNLTYLQSAIERLREALVRHSQNPDDDLLRDGLIKRFEFTFEMSIRTVKRYMKTEENIPPEGDLGYRSAIRAAGQLRLLDSVEDWLIYNGARQDTSHDYDEEKAADVSCVAPRFLEDAVRLLNRLSREGDEEHEGN